MRTLKFSGALHEALDICLETDPSVYLIGLGVPDPTAVFGTTRDLAAKYGPKRVFDMPISESGVTGVAIGSALAGLRPVMIHLRMEFAMLAMDQIANQAAKWRYLFGDGAKVPLTIRMVTGRGWGQSAQHCQSLHAWFAHIPGLTVVMPARPYDAKGLLIASIESNNPVIFVEHRWLYDLEGPVPEGHYTVPLGQPVVLRSGSAATVVASGYLTWEAHRAAKVLAQDGIEIEIIDLRTLTPLNDAPILESVQKTGRLVVCDHATYTGSFAGEIIARVSEAALGALRAPPIRVTLPDAPTPMARALTNYYYPGVAHIVQAVRKTLGLPTKNPADSIGATDPLDVFDYSLTGPF